MNGVLRGTSWLVIGVAAALGVARSASAAGAIEINHAKALAGGVSSEDTPGYPVTIFDPGSYVLTGNLQQSDPELHAIFIVGSDVVLDLGGFAITGPNFCPESCATTGPGGGVYSTGDRNVVRNGTVRGVAARGVWGFSEGRIERVIASHNGQNGIAGGSDTVVQSSMALYNQLTGISVGSGGAVIDSTSAHNLEIGIAVDSPATIARSSVRQNAGDGIYVQSGGRIAIRDCQIESNGGDGIDMLGGFLQGNRISGHSMGAPPAPPVFGILVRGNVAIQLDGNVLHDNNTGNASAQISTSGAILSLSGNVCGSDLVCP